MIEAATRGVLQKKVFIKSGCLMRPLDFQFLTDSVSYCNKNEK